MVKQFLKRFSARRQPDERHLYPHIFEREERVNPQDSSAPEVTVGSIVLWALLKMAVLVFATWYVIEQYRLHYYWLVALAAIVGIVVIPAYRQYERFTTQTRLRSGGLLCSKCKHFDETGVLCTLYDEHVSKSHIPCGGDSWEAKSPRYEV
jgi:hypothetical protein